MLIIDRFEGDYAVVETSIGTINVPICDLPLEVKEGDVLAFSVDSDTTGARAERIERKMDRLFRD